ncbi:phosphoglycerate kinase, partial [Klebsiella pneumoniae]|nr:phosphoglycerate kinase [Klebsiella pneumoniae]
RLSRLLKKEVKFVKDVIGDKAKKAVNGLKSGDILLLDNLRFQKGETSNDDKFAKTLASFADYYINDAFGVCHRAHASVEAITKFF